LGREERFVKKIGWMGKVVAGCWGRMWGRRKRKDGVCRRRSRLGNGGSGRSFGRSAEKRLGNEIKLLLGVVELRKDLSDRRRVYGRGRTKNVWPSKMTTVSRDVWIGET
jgi:hypothetical protein